MRGLGAWSRTHSPTSQCSSRRPSQWRCPTSVPVAFDSHSMCHMPSHRRFDVQFYLLCCTVVQQVYYARVRATGQPVAVKVQRPGALSTISKDLYVMRRGVGVYEQLVKRFTAQTTDYQQLLSTFAEGLYTEMDFRNEVGGWVVSQLSWRCLLLVCLLAALFWLGWALITTARTAVAAVFSCHQTRAVIKCVIRPVLAVCVLQALNAMKMREVLAEAPGLASERLVIPQPLLELTTRYSVAVRTAWPLHTCLLCHQMALHPCLHIHTCNGCLLRCIWELRWGRASTGLADWSPDPLSSALSAPLIRSVPLFRFPAFCAPRSFCSPCRRVMTMEWITGVKLTTLPPDEIRDLVGVGQEAFLVQLLEVGFFHGDPHPGNLLKVGFWVPLFVTHITHPLAHQVFVQLCRVDLLCL